MFCTTRHIHTCTEQEKQGVEVFPYQEVGYDFHVKIIKYRQGQKNIDHHQFLSQKEGDTYGFWSMESKDKVTHQLKPVGY